jgi:biopolymer transport protein ExbB/TolQ
MRYDIEAAKLASERAARVLHRTMGRGRAGLAAIASTAAFVGILTTSIDIVRYFPRITEHSHSECDCSGDPSEVLVTTAIGVLVAIVASWCRWYLSRRLAMFDTEMRAATLELANFLGHRNRINR